MSATRHQRAGVSSVAESGCGVLAGGAQLGARPDDVRDEGPPLGPPAGLDLLYKRPTEYFPF